MTAWKFDLERQTRKHFLALRKQQLRDHRAEANTLPTEMGRKARRTQLRHQREADGGAALLEQAKAMALHDQDIIERGKVFREHKRTNIAIREARWQAEKAEATAKRLREKADEAERNAEYKAAYARRLAPVTDG